MTWARNLSKCYRKAPTFYIKNINNEPIDITAMLGVSDNVQGLYEMQAFLRNNN